MLQRLCAAGFVPEAIVEERSGFARKKTTAYLDCLGPDEIPPSTQSIAAQFRVPFETVESINGQRCEEVVRSAAVAMVVLGNTNIVKPPLLARARRGCLNIHPGLLPRIRGAFPQCWSILRDEPIGCSAHFCEVDVDMGPILKTRQITVFEGDTLERVVVETMRTGADLLLESLTELSRGEVPTIRQAPEDGESFRWPTSELIAAAKEKLARGDYRHLTPRPPKP